MAAKVPGSTCAAQPVTDDARAPGARGRCGELLWRAWRVASAVTAQVIDNDGVLKPGLAGLAFHGL